MVSVGEAPLPDAAAGECSEEGAERPRAILCLALAAFLFPVFNSDGSISFTPVEGAAAPLGWAADFTVFVSVLVGSWVAGPLLCISSEWVFAVVVWS